MIRIGIIGTDFSADLHTTAILAGSAFEIVGCYDKDSRKSMLFARKYRLISYSSFDALLNYAEVIDIASETPDTCLLAERSLKAFKHVLLSHPHLLSTQEIRYLAKLADESGVILQLGTKYNHSPVECLIKGLKHAPQTVQINHLLNMVNGQTSIQCLKNELLYDLFFMQNLLNANIAKIDITGLTEDEFQVRIALDNGSLVSLNLSLEVEAKSTLTLRCSFPEMIVEADVFRSTASINYKEFDVVDSQELEPYNERKICVNMLVELAVAISEKSYLYALMNPQIQHFAATDVIINYISQAKTLITPPSNSYRDLSRDE
ncbi:MAG: Gfo/Idh/MocA family oxidoreductase [Bacteroidales bacterium]|jgi:hypothetical protein|nr:Gfo/Idh/MocA family oxidoreductase [Bacteroidales bacterium]